MSGSSTRIQPGDPRRTVAARGLSAVRDVIDELRSTTSPRTTAHPGRDDVRASVLAVLAEHPANGYQIVRALEDRAPGTNTPGAGAVYPTLQLLGDEGLATAEESDGRKTWTLTAGGRAAAEAALRRAGAGAGVGADAIRTPERRGALARSGAQLVQAVSLAAQSGTPAQLAEVVAVLDDARRKVLSILARS